MIGRKHFILLFFILIGFSGKTQVELYIDTVTGGVGSQVVVPVRADNFTNLVSMQGTLHFNPAVVSFTSIEQLGVPGLSLGNFGTTQSGIGNISFSWFDANLSGESVANGSVIFAIRFTIIGSPGQTSPVWLNSNPTLLEFVDNNFNTLSYTTTAGLVVVGGQPAPSSLTLFADSVIANQNDTVVVPIRVRDFDIIVGAQGTIGFDPSVADYVSVEQFGVPNMSSANFGITQVGVGNLMFSWNAPTTSGVSLPDSSILFAVKYHVIGSGGSSTDISFLGGPTPMEIVDSNLSVLNPYLAAGNIQVLSDTNAIFKLIIDTVMGAQTQLVNVPIRAWAFDQILSMQGTFDFDTSVIYFNSVVNFGLPDLSSSNFGTTQVNNGLLSYSWFDQDLMGETYADSAILFELVFQVHGNIGDFGYVISNSEMTPIEVVELGNLVIPYELDSGGVIVTVLTDFVSIQTPTNLNYCAGDSISLVYQTNASLNTGNVFTLELSDETGSFSNPLIIGSLASTQDTAVISGFIPVPFLMGSSYRFRVNSSSPNLIGIETNVNFSIEYYEDTVSTVLCNGDSLFVGGAWQVNPGFYGDTLTTINGCDSVIVTNISFTSAIIDSIYVDLCQGDSLFLGGQWQMNAGWYVDSLLAASGCDSLIRTNVTLLNVSNTPVSQSICVGDSLFLQGAWQNLPGLYIDSLTGINGCDSLLSTTLSNYPSNTTNLAQQICAGDSVFLAGNWQFASGTYTDIYPSIFGCDSTVITNLTVLAPNEFFDTLAVCFGDSLFIGGAWETASGNYVNTYLAANGCDSTVFTNLTVKNQITETFYPSICSGDSLFVEGSWQLTAGIYTDSLVAADGCDSLRIFDLTIIPQINTFASVTICDGDSLLIHGQYQSLPNVYIDTLVAQTGCDSIASVTLSVEVHPLYSNAVQICSGDSLFVGGQWQTIPGFYLDTLSSALGCDSILQTNLSVLLEIVLNTNASICLGDSLFLGGAWQQSPGNYNDTLVAAAGCDSIVTTTLSVLLPTFGSETIVICDGDSTLISGMYQSTSGTYQDILVGVNGCDSIVTVVLVVNPTYFVQNTQTICQGDSLFLAGNYQFTSGIYLDTNFTVLGCDSITATTLTVTPPPLVSVTLSICQGDSILVNGNYLSAAGVYTDTLQTASGCDSIVETNLLLNPNYFIQNTLSICQGDSTFLQGAYQFTSGIYLDTMATISGCDSIVETTLTINPIYFVQNTASICQGDSLFLQGTYVFLPGIYLDTTSTILGCDSIVETTLTVNPTYFVQNSASICQGDSLFAGGSYQYNSGIYFDTTATQFGCDSIVETTLTVTPAPVYNQSLVICQGDSVLINGVYESLSGTYVNTYQTANSCDSIVQTTLTVNPAPIYNQTFVICQGDSALINGVYESLAGTYVNTYQTTNGCDSIVSILLVVNPTYFVQETASICQGESILLGGANQTTAGIYTDTYQTVNGCDSIVQTTLTVNPAPIYNQTITICQGDSVLVNGVYESLAGTYVNTYQTTNGCDSIVSIVLVVNPTYFAQATVSVCQGDSILLGGVYQTTAGIYTDTNQTVNGCDSIVQTTLTVNPAPIYNQTITICQGDSALINGVYESLAGTYVNTYQTATGCDSIVSIVLVVNPTYFVQETAGICQGESILLGGANQTTAGVYTDTYQTVNGCDSIVETTLTVNPTPSSSSSITICEGETVLVNGNLLSSAGTYVDTLQTALGCDSLVTTILNVTVIDPTVSINSPTLTANYSGATSYQWINCDSGFPIGNGTDQEFTAVANGSYQVQIVDQGCTVLSDCYDILDVSIDEMDLVSVLIYPNPTRDYFTVVQDKPSAWMQLLDVYGKMIQQGEVGNQFTVSLANHPEGIYFLVLDGKNFKVVKF